jgi:hypothetical protein
MSGRTWANGRSAYVTKPAVEKGPSKGQQAAADALETILGMFESGDDMPEAIASTVIARIEGLAPMASWSLPNQLLALKAGTTDARGYRQWEAVGRHVAKGERAIYILAPVTRKVKDTDKATGEETSRPIVLGFKGIPVFAYESTEGMPIERENFDPPELPPLHEVAEMLGVSVEYAPAPAGCDYHGFYQPDKERILLVTHAERTFFHELAHAAHRRVLQARGQDLTGGQNPAQEIVAETVAATLCQLYGFGGYIFQGREYVARYAEQANIGSPAKAAIKVLADVQATLYLIVDTALEAGAFVPEVAAA